MFLLYVDESGNPVNSSEQYFVMGAVAVYETTAYFISQGFDEIQEKYFPGSTNPIEFHSAQVMNHNAEPWRAMTRPDREQMLFDLCDVLVRSNQKGLHLFGVAVDKASFPQDDPVEKAFHELCGHFDKFIDQTNWVKSKEMRNRGLMIFDSSRYAGHLDKLLLEYRKEGGTKFGRVKNFADAPAFAKSETTRLLQAADLVSYALFRRYERSDARLFDRILSRFQQSDGILHGLTHLVARHWTCFCPACLSRRQSTTQRNFTSMTPPEDDDSETDN